MYYNLNSQIIELDKMSSIGPNADIFNYPIYDNEQTYEQGNKVKYNDELYEAVGTVTGESPDTSANFQKLEPFSDWLEDFTNTVIFRLCEAVSTQKKINRQAKSLLNDLSLFPVRPKIGDTSSYLPNNGRFVAIKLSALQKRDIDLRINQLVFTFSEAQTDLPIYVFHSSQLEPLQVINVSTTKARSSEIVTIPEINLKYNSDEYTRGGCFYIGYYQDDINGNAIKDTKYKFQKPCTCDAQGYRHYKEYSQFVNAKSVYIDSQNYTVGEMWDTDKERTDSCNYGLNIRLTAQCSLNGFICENKNIFAQALIIQAEMIFAESVINTGRTNTFDERLLDQAAFNLSDSGLNLPQKLADEIDAMDFDLSDLDSPCAPKKTRRIYSMGV